MVTISVELRDDIAAGLSRLALDRASTPEALLSAWVTESMLARQELEARAIEARADLAAGRTLSHDEAMADLEDWAKTTESDHRKRR
jgi:predicted transcriptional regulator